MDGTIAGQEPGCKDPLSNPAFLRSAEKWLGFSVRIVARSRPSSSSRRSWGLMQGESNSISHSALLKQSLTPLSLTQNDQ